MMMIDAVSVKFKRRLIPANQGRCLTPIRVAQVRVKVYCDDDDVEDVERGHELLDSVTTILKCMGYSVMTPKEYEGRLNLDIYTPNAAFLEIEVIP